MVLVSCRSKGLGDVPNVWSGEECDVQDSVCRNVRVVGSREQDGWMQVLWGKDSEQ